MNDASPPAVRIDSGTTRGSDDRRRLRASRGQTWVEQIRRPGVLLAIVAVAFVVVQLILFDEGRFLEWDEAVYVDKATDRFTGAAWSVHRALGTAWLLVPLFEFTASFSAMRYYLLLASSFAIALAFASWLRPFGRLAALGMLLFCANWLTLFYGSEASPNLYVAAACVGAVGQLVQVDGNPSRRTLVLLAAAVALATLFRPTDGVVLVAGVSAGGFLLASRRFAWKVPVAAVAGSAVGFIPWIVDSLANFGGPIDRWQEASALVESSLRWQVSNHAKLLDGPLVGPDDGSGYPVANLAIVFALVALSIWAALRSDARRASAITLGMACFAAAPYLFYVGASAPRFLLPAFGLLSMSAAIGIGGLWHRWNSARVFTTGLIVAMGVVAIAQANHEEGSQYRQREEAQLVGEAVRSLAGERDCRVLSQYGSPQIALASGCAGQRLDVSTAGCQVQRLAGVSEVVLVSFLGEAPDDLAPAITDEMMGPRGWRVAIVDPALALCE